MTSSVHAATSFPPFLSSRRPRILLGITGSVAAVKGPKLALRLVREVKADVKVVLTRTVEHYFWKEGKAVPSYDIDSWREFLALVSSSMTNEDAGGEDCDWMASDGRLSVHYAEEEWATFTCLQDTVLHIDHRNWADICLIAPLSAHTLAKIAHGLCDDLLTCCIRAWDFGQGSSSLAGKPVILAPAMNTGMWYHPLTKIQLETIRRFSKDDKGVIIIEPAVKTLACGEIGVGALAEIDDIIHAVTECLANGRTVNAGNDVSQIGIGWNYSSTSSISSATSRKELMKRALLLFAKQKFVEQIGSNQNTPSPQLAAPISPTPRLVIKALLPRLNLDSNSFLVDLGCGDGRWLIAAHQHAKCRCLGIDVDEERLNMAREAISKHSLQNVVQVRNMDLVEFIKDGDDICEADVIVIYLFRGAILEIGAIMKQTLMSRKTKWTDGSQKVVQILSVGFALPGWTPIYEDKIGGLKVYIYSI